MAKKKAKTKHSKPATPVSFESSLAELKQLVAELEAGNLPLETALEKYEAGVQQVNNCHRALQQAQQRISKLVDLDQDGNLIVEPFDNTSSTEHNDGVRRKSESAPDVEEAGEFDDDDDEYAGELF